MKVTMKIHFTQIITLLILLLTMDNQAMEIKVSESKTQENIQVSPKQEIEEGDMKYVALETTFKYKSLPTLISLIENKKDILKVSSNAQIKSKNGSYNFLLHKAIISEWLEGVRYLIEKKALIDAKDSEGLTPLMWAAYLNVDTEIIRTLMDNGADATQYSKCQPTALDCLKEKYYGTERGKQSIEIIHKKLLEIDMKYKAFYEIIQHKNFNALSDLINNGFNVNAQLGSSDFFPIMAVVEEDWLQGIELLLEKNADLNALTVRGCSALCLAVRRGNLELVEFLLKKGAIPYGGPLGKQTDIDDIIIQSDDAEMQELLTERRGELEVITSNTQILELLIKKHREMLESKRQNK